MTRNIRIGRSFAQTEKRFLCTMCVCIYFYETFMVCQSFSEAVSTSLRLPTGVHPFCLNIKRVSISNFKAFFVP